MLSQGIWLSFEDFHIALYLLLSFHWFLNRLCGFQFPTRISLSWMKLGFIGFPFASHQSPQSAYSWDGLHTFWAASVRSHTCAALLIWPLRSPVRSHSSQSLYSPSFLWRLSKCVLRWIVSDLLMNRLDPRVVLCQSLAHWLTLKSSDLLDR